MQPQPKSNTTSIDYTTPTFSMSQWYFSRDCGYCSQYRPLCLKFFRTGASVDAEACIISCRHPRLSHFRLHTPSQGSTSTGLAQARPGPPIAHVDLQSRELRLMRKTPVSSGRLHVSRILSQFYSGAVALMIGPPYLNETDEATVSRI